MCFTHKSRSIFTFASTALIKAETVKTITLPTYFACAAMRVMIDHADLERIDLDFTNALFVENMQNHCKMKQAAAVAKADKKKTKPKKRPNVKYYFERNLVEYRRALVLYEEKKKLKIELKSIGPKTEKIKISAKVKELAEAIDDLSTIEFYYFAKNHRPYRPSGALRIHADAVDKYKDSLTGKVPDAEVSRVITVEEAFDFLTDMWKKNVSDHPNINHTSLYRLVNERIYYGITTDMCKAYVGSVSKCVLSLPLGADDDASLSDDDNPPLNDDNPPVIDDNPPVNDDNPPDVANLNEESVVDNPTLVSSDQEPSNSTLNDGSAVANPSVVSTGQDVDKSLIDESAGENPSLVLTEQQCANKLLELGRGRKKVNALALDKEGAVVKGNDVALASTVAITEASGVTHGNTITGVPNAKKDSVSLSKVDLVHGKSSASSIVGSNLNEVTCGKIIPSDTVRTSSVLANTNVSSVSLGNNVSSQQIVVGVSDGPTDSNGDDKGDSGAKSTASLVSGTSNVVDLCSDDNGNEEEDGNKIEDNHLRNLELYHESMKVGLEQKKFYHLMVDMVSVNWKGTMGSKHIVSKCEFVLVVMCLVTKFTVFRQVKIATDHTEIAGHLLTIFGDFGFPRTVSYYKCGIAFNKNRYPQVERQHTYQVRFDSETKFGHSRYCPQERNRHSFLMSVHNSLFGSNPRFKDYMSRFIACCTDYNSVLDHVKDTVVSQFVDQVNSVWVNDSPHSDTAPVFVHYPSAQLHVNVSSGFFYGPAEKCVFPQMENRRCPFEKMFSRSCCVHEYVKDRNVFGIINHWMGGGDDFMNSSEYCRGVMDQKNSKGETQIVNFGTMEKNARRMYCHLAAEESYYPPALLPDGVPRHVQGKVVLDNNPDRLKEIRIKEKKSHLPIGIINDNHYRALNVVFLFLQDIPVMNALVCETVRYLVKTKREYSDVIAIVLTYVYCGRRMYEKGLQRNLSQTERHISINPLSDVLKHKVSQMNNFHLEENDSAGKVIRLLFTFLCQELFHVFPAKESQFSGIFKKMTVKKKRCSKCDGESWQTVCKREEDSFTLPLAIPVEIEKDADLMYRPTSTDGFDIHLQDVINLCSKSKSGEDCPFKIQYKQLCPGYEGRKCVIENQKMFGESPPFIIVELNRGKNVSKENKSSETISSSKEDISVFVPGKIYISVKSAQPHTKLVQYTFVSAICLQTDSQLKDYWFLMKPQFDSTFLKVMDQEMSFIDNKLGTDIIQRKSSLLLFKKMEINPSQLKDNVIPKEFPFCVEINKFANRYVKSSRTSVKRSLSFSNEGGPKKVPKVDQIPQDNTLVESFFPTPRGLVGYYGIPPGDDSTTFEQNCLYCGDMTPQFVGNLTYICEGCNKKPVEQNSFILQDFEVQVNNSVEGRCIACNKAFRRHDRNMYHQFGEYKCCLKCINTQKCRCFACAMKEEYKASSEIITLRGHFTMKRMTMNMEMLEFQQSNTQGSKQDLAILNTKAENIVNSFLHRSPTPEERSIMSKTQLVEQEYVCIHQSYVLANAPFQKYFFGEDLMHIPRDVLEFYIDICKDSVIVSQNKVRVSYTESHIEAILITTLQSYETCVHLFVSFHATHHWRCLEIDLTDEKKIGLTYFDTGDVNRSTTVLTIKKQLERILSTRQKNYSKQNSNPSVVIDNSWEDLFDLTGNKVCDETHSGLYMTTFLLNRSGNLKTTLNKGFIKRMKEHLCLSILTGEAFYY